jgi:hypothetical protein
MGKLNMGRGGNMENSDSELHEIIKNNCNTAVKYAASFGYTLDLSDESINKVEEILDYYANDLLSLNQDESPTENQIWSMASIWGSYVGEVMVRNIGEPCRWVYVEGEYLVEAQGATANPIGKAFKRLINGSEDNINSFYDIISFKIKEHIANNY